MQFRLWVGEGGGASALLGKIQLFTLDLSRGFLRGRIFKSQDFVLEICLNNVYGP